MKLWLSCFLLFASALLSSSAPSPEECQALVAPVPLDGHPNPRLYRRLNLLVGYNNQEPFKTFLKKTKSAWGKFSPSPTSPNEIILFQARKIDGVCIESTANVMLEGDTATSSAHNRTTVTHMLRSSEGCQVHITNKTIKNFKHFLKIMKIDIPFAPDEIHTRALHLLCPGTTVTASVLEHFKKQAHCLGFSGEPDFHYNPENSFCQEGEGLTFPELMKCKAAGAN